ncbi:class I SAM-dependent DNA methyltransferase [Ureibacillus acetophenoni]|uniref:Methyltransferase family protein n=1 Tax=Ureibacillus acetophenoni TaxID=614649 RepID=A0A285U353_9BACL|nr:class I SAM-dependent methyltransferase [Ureibacillus acetophenoni]SOC36355.1 methyltransferase family protein [Ureibacillus acetophenoni]
MSNYVKFAEVYDVLMQDVPYNEYINWVKKYAPSEEYPLLLDVGCGTGTLTSKFHQEGYDVSGIDLSEEMLAIANDRAMKEGISIPFFQMSMDEIDGFQNYDVITIPIDSINYLQDEHSVQETFKRIYESLRKGGQLFFDVHSLYKMNEIFMESPFTYDDGNILYVWHTEEGEDEHSVYHQMTFFVKESNTEKFVRFDEEHYQRTFPIDFYKEWLYQSGFSKVEIYADFTDEDPDFESERIFFRAIK